MLYMSQVFDDKSRQKYGLISNFIYNMKSAKEWDNKLFWFQILMVVPTVAASLLGTYLPSRLVADLSGQMGIPRLLLELTLISLALWACNAASNVALEYCELQGAPSVLITPKNLSARSWMWTTIIWRMRTIRRCREMHGGWPVSGRACLPR